MTARIAVRIHAPFAAYRGMQAGVYRTSAPTIPPSAAWGLLLNFGAFETRAEGWPATLVSPTAPALRIAIANVDEATRCTLYQQLHSYPVGASFKELAARTHGAKYAIQPITREILVGLTCVVVAEGDAEVIERIAAGVRGELDVQRYGLPFAGDNNYLIDKVELLEELPELRWFETLDVTSDPRSGSCRLTVGIDRADASRTTSALVAPSIPKSTEPPESAWFWTPAQPSG